MTAEERYYELLNKQYELMENKASYEKEEYRKLMDELIRETRNMLSVIERKHINYYE